MRTGDLLFIFIILIVCCFGGILAFSSGQNPTTVTDSFGNSMSNQTNKSATLVTDVAVGQAQYEGWFILFVAVVLVIIVVIGAMYHLRKGRIGGGRYRTG